MRLALLLLLPTLATAASPEAIHRSIAEGRCREAVQEIRKLGPPTQDPALWRLLGDAHRCLGEARPAVLAYRKHLAVAGPAADISELVSGLRERLGRLVVTVRPDRGVASQVDAVFLDETRQRGVEITPGVWSLDDLEPGQSTNVVVRGLGLESLRTRAPAVPVGGQASIELRPRWVGVARLKLADARTEGLEVEVTRAGEAVVLRPGVEESINAGRITVGVVSERGRVEFELDLEGGQREVVDPTPWAPTRLTINDVPAGSSVRLFLEGVDPPLERELNTAADVGEIDPSFGVRLAPAIQLDGLVGGPATLVVSHAILGVVAVELTLGRGGDNAAQVGWRGRPEALGVQAEWQSWKARDAASRRGTQVPVIAGAVAGGVGVLVSVIGWAAAGAQQATLADSQSQALSGAAHPDGPTGWYDDHQAALASQQGAMGGAIGGAIVGVAGFGVAGVFGAKAGAKTRKQEAWTPP